jgi:hypothetical protein
MNIEQRLNYVADRYRIQGYQVVVRPDRDALPAFAKDFKVEILATREDSNVLASAKGSPLELEADPNVARYAEITNQQPGWRFDLFVLGPESQGMPQNREAKEPSEEEIQQALDDVERMLQAGFMRPSLTAAWAALEAAMRRRLRAEGEEAGWGTSPRTILNELYSAGVISTGVLRQLEGFFQLRNAIVHGFSSSVVVDATAVQFLVNTARRLLTESQPARQTA